MPPKKNEAAPNEGAEDQGEQKTKEQQPDMAQLMAMMVSLMSKIATGSAEKQSGELRPKLTASMPKFGEKREEFEKFLRRVKAVMAAKSEDALGVVEAALEAKEEPTPAMHIVKRESSGDPVSDKTRADVSRTVYALIAEACSDNKNVTRLLDVEWKVPTGDGLKALWRLKNHFLKADQAQVLDLEEKLLQDKQGSRTLATYLLDVQDLMVRLEQASGEVIKNKSRVLHVLRGLDARYKDEKEDIMRDFLRLGDDNKELQFDRVLERLKDFRRIRKIQDADETGGRGRGGKVQLALETILKDLPISKKEKKKLTNWAKKRGTGGKRQGRFQGECFNCGKEGHRKAECRQQGRCFNCGKEGHRSAKCRSPCGECGSREHKRWRNGCPGRSPANGGGANTQPPSGSGACEELKASVAKFEKGQDRDAGQELVRAAFKAAAAGKDDKAFDVLAIEAIKAVQKARECGEVQRVEEAEEIDLSDPHLTDEERAMVAAINERRRNGYPDDHPGFDSCASDHYLGKDAEPFLMNIRAAPADAGGVMTADGTYHRVRAIADTPNLKNVKWVPGLKRKKTLVCVAKLEKEGRDVVFSEGKVYLRTADQRMDLSKFQCVGHRTTGNTYAIHKDFIFGKKKLVKAAASRRERKGTPIKVVSEVTVVSAALLGAMPRAGGIGFCGEVTYFGGQPLCAAVETVNELSDAARAAGVTPAILKIFVAMHNSVGHPSGEQMAKNVQAGHVLVDERLTPDIIRACAAEYTCVPCLLAKVTKQPIKRKAEPRTKPERPGALMCMDLVGPVTPTSVWGDRHGSMIVDACTGAHFTEAVKKKPDAVDHFDEVLSGVIKPLHEIAGDPSEPMTLGLRTDNAPELVGEPMTTVLRKHNVTRVERTGVQSSYQNGLAEGAIRHASETTRAMMVRARMPAQLWPHAWREHAFLQQRRPPSNSTDGLAPLHKMLRTKQPLDLTWLRPIWSPAFIVRIQRERVRSAKFQAIGDIARLIGHVPGRKAYRLQRLRDNKVVIRSPRFVFFLQGRADEFRVGDELNDAALRKSRAEDGYDSVAENGEGVQVEFGMRDDCDEQVVVSEDLPDGFPELGLQAKDDDEDLCLEDAVDEEMAADDPAPAEERRQVYVPCLGTVRAPRRPGDAPEIVPETVPEAAPAGGPRRSSRRRAPRKLHNVGHEEKWERMPVQMEEKKTRRLASQAGRAGQRAEEEVRRVRFAGVDEDQPCFEGVNAEGRKAEDGEDAVGQKALMPSEEVEEEVSDGEEYPESDEDDEDGDVIDVAKAEVDELLTRYWLQQGRDDFCVRCLVGGDAACRRHQQDKARVEEILALDFGRGYTRRQHGDEVVCEATEMVSEYGMSWPKDLPNAPLKKRLEEVYIPRTLQDALSCEDRHYWARAMAAEFRQMDDHGVWKPEPLPKTGEKVLTPMVAFTPQDKEGKGFVTKFKARLCCRGFQQVEGLHYDEVFAPTIRHASVRLELAMIVREGLAARQFDFKAAYLNAPLDKPLLMRAPAGYPIRSGMVLRLLKALYGLRQAGKCWNDAVTKGLKALGFRACLYDPCVFIRGKPGDADRAIIGIHVDDGILGAKTPEAADKLIKELSKLFPMGHSGPLDYFLGLKIEHSRKLSMATISGATFIESLLRKFHMDDCNTAPNPCVSGVSALPKATDEEAFRDGSREHRAYQILVGCCTWMCTTCRPDIAFAVTRLQTHMARPCERHFKAGKRLLRYLKGTKHYGLVFRGNCVETPLLWAHSDSDFAGDVDTRRSTGGMVVYGFGALIDWRSKKLKGVDVSVGSAEYKMASEAARTLLYSRNLMKELGYATVRERGVDNPGGLQAAEKLCYSGRQKHLEVTFHFIREVVHAKEVLLKKVASANNRADVMTKALTNPEFLRQREFLVQDVRSVWAAKA